MASDYTQGYTDYLSDTSDNYNGDNRTELFSSQLPPLSLFYSFVHHDDIKKRADKHTEQRNDNQTIRKLNELKARIKNYLNGEQKDLNEEEFLILYPKLFKTTLITQAELDNFILSNDIDVDDILGKMIISIHLCEVTVAKLKQKALKQVNANDLFMGK
jgi:hypothetical protein